MWTADERELTFRNGPRFFSVRIASMNPFRAEAPRLLFESNAYRPIGPVRGRDGTPDGQRLLLTRLEESAEKPVTQIQVVLNWTEELKRRVRGK